MGLSLLPKAIIKTLSLADDITRAIGGAFIRAGDEAVIGLKKWWGKGIKEGIQVGEMTAEEAAAKSIRAADDILEQMTRTINSGKKSIGMFSQQIDNFSKAASGTLKEAGLVLDEITKAPSKLVSGEEVNAMKSFLNTAKSLLERKEFGAAISHIDGNRRLAEKIMSLSPNTNIMNIKDGLFGIMKKADTIAKMDDSALSNVQFLNKYLKLGPQEKQLWVSNVNNSRRLEKLRSYKQIREMITQGLPKVPTRERLRGLTLADKAKKLGVGTAALAGAGKAMGVFDVFSDYTPNEATKTTRPIEISFDEFKTYGYGTTVLNKVTTSLKKIGDIVRNVSTSMATDPQKAAQKYVQDVNKELVNLDNIMKDWDSVAEGSDNPEAARAAVPKIQKFAVWIAKSVQDLGGAVGVTDYSAGIASLDRPRGDREDILRVQKFLLNKSNEYGFLKNIRLTGIADPATISALKKLEDAFNKRTGAENYEFTGSMVDEKSGYIAQYSLLLELFDMIGEY